MRVCHVSDVHGINDNRIFYKECISLAEIGYDVVLIAVGRSDICKGVLRIGLKKYPRLLRIIVGPIMAYRAAIKINADVYHLHDPELLTLVPLFRWRKKKIIFDSHEDYYQQIRIKKYIPAALRSPIAKAYEKYQKKMSQYLDGFILPAESASIKIDIPITIVGNSPILNTLQVSIPFADKSNSICYIGGLTEDRGIRWLIKASCQAGVKLILAGPFESDDYYRELRQMPEYSIVDYRGCLDHSKIKTILGESKIGMAVLMNTGQYANGKTLATKVMEYCQYGLPVILSKTTYNQMMVDKYHFGICVDDPTDTKRYAKAIRDLIDSSEQLESLGKNGRKLIETELNWRNDFKNLERLYLKNFN